jgi:hypothetical protein
LKEPSGEVLIGDDVPFDFKKDENQNEEDDHSKEIVEFIESLDEEEKSGKEVEVEKPSFTLQPISPEKYFSAKAEDNLDSISPQTELKSPNLPIGFPHQLQEQSQIPG